METKTLLQDADVEAIDLSATYLPELVAGIVRRRPSGRRFEEAAKAAGALTPGLGNQSEEAAHELWDAGYMMMEDAIVVACELASLVALRMQGEKVPTPCQGTEEEPTP